MTLKASLLKEQITPSTYYSTVLKGRPSKINKDGWVLWLGKCPFHNDKHVGSFHINTKTGAFKCFSCGASGGDIIDFHMRYYNLTFNQALFDLCKEVK